MMDTETKLALVTDQMHLEPAEEVRPLRSSGTPVARCGFAPDALRTAVESGAPSTGLEPKKDSLGLYDAVMPGGKRITLLKTLLTSACERDCYYCPFRAKRNYRRATFKPEEMAHAFHQMFDARVAQGLFVSSGVAGGGIRTQDRLIATAEILRRKYHYAGFLHLKIMPGADREQVWRAMQLADRISINLEAPNAERLTTLAPHKVFQELVRPLQWAEEIRQNYPPHLAWNGRMPSTVTQFVVGAAGESDVEILATSSYLIQQLHLARTYFSAFSPVTETPLETHAPENPLREHRLYQASFLIRSYEFEMEEMPFDPQGNLPLETDPKLGWAQRHLVHEPIELNHAERRDLLRIPGVGPRGADTILAARRRGRLTEPRDLAKLGIAVSRAAPFVLLDGRRPPRQLALW